MKTKKTTVQELGFLVTATLVVCAFIWLILPFYSAILWAIIPAILFDPLHRKFESRLDHPRGARPGNRELV